MSTLSPVLMSKSDKRTPLIERYVNFGLQDNPLKRTRRSTLETGSTLNAFGH